MNVDLTMHTIDKYNWPNSITRHTEDKVVEKMLYTVFIYLFNSSYKGVIQIQEAKSSGSSGIAASKA